MRRRQLIGFLFLTCFSTVPAVAADGNRLAYLDQSDPYYVSRTFP